LSTRLQRWQEKSETTNVRPQTPKERLQKTKAAVETTKAYLQATKEATETTITRPQTTKAISNPYLDALKGPLKRAFSIIHIKLAKPPISNQ
jgi:hypothetical protein